MTKKSAKHSTDGQRNSSRSLLQTYPGPQSMALAHYVELCDVWFQKGRNPWRDLYTPEVMQKIAACLKIDDDAVLTRLKRALCRLAERCLVELEETAFYTDDKPAGLTYRDRKRWLQTNVLGPVSKLCEALQQSGYFSVFPLDQGKVMPPSAAVPALIDELVTLERWVSALVERTSALAEEGDGSNAPAAKPVTDFKYALVWELTKIYAQTPVSDGSLTRGGRTLRLEHRVPALSSSVTSRRRGTYVQEKGGEYLDFIRLAARPILNKPESLTAEAQIAVAKFKEGP